MIKVNVILSNIAWKKYLKNPHILIEKKVNLKLSGQVVTKSSLLKNYCPAEEYHQRYLEKR